MSDGKTDTHERTNVGVVAPETNVSRIVEAVADAGGIANTDSTNVTESDIVVAVGDAALTELTAIGPSIPILPVETSVDSVSRENLHSAIECVLAGTDEIRNRPLVRVETGHEHGRALFDVTLSTAEPATISGFSLDTLHEATGRDSSRPVARFRADGVVVTTPVGSRGYGRAAGGPVVVPGSDVLSVVPISPFATDPDHWVLSLSGLSLTVERDEVDCELFVDGQALCTVAPGSTVRLVRDGTLRFAVVSDSHESRE